MRTDMGRGMKLRNSVSSTFHLASFYFGFGVGDPPPLVPKIASQTPHQGPTMVGLTLLLDLWKKNQSFNTARTYQSSSFFSASATVASFAAATSFSSKDFFGPPVAYCDAGAIISEDRIPSMGKVPGKYFYHDSLKYTTNKHYNIEPKPLFSAFELKSFTIITFRSFLMFYLPLMEPHAKMEQDDVEFLQDKKGLTGNLSIPFKKSLLQIIREVTVVTTRRILERITVYYVSRRMAWKLLKDVPESAVRKAGRKMPTLVYICSVSKTTFRGYMLGVSASWLVQVGVGLFQYFKSKSKNENLSSDVRVRILRQKVFLATVRCNASLIFASIGAGIGAALIPPSLGQWIGCAAGDLVGPVIVAVCAEKVFHKDLLANPESEECLEEYVERNTIVVTELYKALTSKQTETLHGLVAQDLEWWFHGPPCHQHHLVPWLTGSTPSSKAPVPEHVVGFGPVVIAEAFDEAHLVWWVHAWTVSVDGLITEVREYVNTSVTVTRLSQALPNASKCQCIWESKLCGESVPGLILAI
ncbi:unnamed protein product [Sphenostylis stenocarpa]|uniref:Uncharacterized protein n=1 Tax=Sphenostylis stenocarpa TaxID=92480 RepID=A0AA86SHY4_9FABA|nr:unnamed protein product [Sphenostylis stenocarpa]